MARKSGKHLHAGHWAAVSTLLGLISSAYRNLHQWKSNQQPQYTDAETLTVGRRFMSHISDAELNSDGDNARPLDLMCLDGTYPLQRTRPLTGLRLLKT